MRFTWRWPLRRKPSPIARDADDAAAGPPIAPGRQAEPFEPDAALMAGLSERAGERDALPILGPQGGLPATARFLTVAREMAEALPAAAWSQEVVDGAQAPATVGSPDFIATLPSLASFRDPAAIVSGETEGSPFPEWGSAEASTGVFAGGGGAPEGVEGSRPRQGAAASRSSIVARLADRRGPESRATVGRRVTPAPPVLSERAPTAPLRSEPLRRQPAPIRRGLITEQPATAPAISGAPESPLAAPASSGAPDSPPAQPHIQRVTEFPSLDVAAPVASSEIAGEPPPVTPITIEEAPQGLQGPAGHAEEPPPPMQVARLAEEPSTPAPSPASAEAPLPEARPVLPSVDAPTPIGPVEMPLVAAETPPVSRAGPVAGDVERAVGPDVVARFSTVLTPAEMGVQSSVPDLSAGSQPSPPGEDVVSSSRVTGQETPALPLASAPEPVPGAQVEPPPGDQRRTAAGPGEQAPVQPPAPAPVQRVTVEDISESPARPRPTSPGPVPQASPAVGGAGEFASQVIDLEQPLLLTEPWGVALPDGGHEQTDDGGGFDAPAPGATESPAGSPPAGRPPLQPLRARPASAVSRSAETSSEPSRATALPSSRPGGWEASPGEEPPGPGQQRSEPVPALGRPGAPEGLPPLIQPALRPVSRLAGSDEDEASPWPSDRPAAVELRNQPPAGWPAEASQGSSRDFRLPALDLIAPLVTSAAPGASLSMARPSGPGGQGSATSPVSRLADLPLAPVSAVLREGEAARPETAAAESGAGAVGAAVPASPPAAAAAEGEIDKLADRVWQVIRRRLQIERERQRGLP
jgi:hypothetical protein